MSPRTYSVVSWVLFGFLLVSSSYSGARQKRTETPCTSQDGITVEISLAGWAASGRDRTYRAGHPISIKTIIRNTGRSSRRFLLDDHDEYHGTRPFPHGTTARIRDSRGAVLTRNKVSNDDWWSSGYLDSFLHREMPGDAITFQPGEEVVRIVPLEQVLLGCDGIRNGLRRGSYTVQLSLCGVVSNELAIRVT